MTFPKPKNWPYVLRLIWDPVDALDLLDDTGKPDHSKVVPVVVLGIIIVFKAIALPFSLMEMVVLVSASYGQSMWRQFLKSRTATFSERVQHTEITLKNLVEAHKADDGA
jgi:hypothetical protein